MFSCVKTKNDVTASERVLLLHNPQNFKVNALKGYLVKKNVGQEAMHSREPVGPRPRGACGQQLARHSARQTNRATRVPRIEHSVIVMISVLAHSTTSSASQFRHSCCTASKRLCLLSQSRINLIVGPSWLCSGSKKIFLHLTGMSFSNTGRPLISTVSLHAKDPRPCASFTCLLMSRSGPKDDLVQCVVLLRQDRRDVCCRLIVLKSRHRQFEHRTEHRGP